MTKDQEIIHWQRMVRLYKFDYLTGLKQRHDFEVETIHKMTNQTFHLAMYDVVGLHAINREQGYAAGDALIKQVARDIELIDGAWEVYRIGGDEFIGIFFDAPQKPVKNATCASVFSGDYTLLSDMMKDADEMVTSQKIKLNRRRS